MESPKSIIFETYRSELTRLAYRMTGLWSEAEDLVQEAWIRFHSSEVTSSKSFLYRVVTRLCLDHLKSARRRRETYPGSWLPEPTVEINVENEVEAAEQLTLALLVTLEQLNPAERAAFLLRQVYEFEYSDIGSLLGKTETSCRKLVSRAKARLKESRPDFEERRAPDFGLLHELSEAVRGGDVERVVACLKEDAVMTSDGGGKAVSAINPIYGADKIARFFIGIIRKFSPTGTVIPAVVGGYPGLIAWEDGRCTSAMAFDILDSLVHEIWVVRNPDKLANIKPPNSEPKVDFEGT